MSAVKNTDTLSMRRTPVTSEPRLLGDNVATLSLLTASQGHLATLQDDDGDTPLHIAIAQGQVPLVQYLIHIASTSGISLDIYNKMKQTPLHLAVITNQPLVIRFLIAAGVDINMPDRNGQTAIHLACQRSSVECLMELVNSHMAINLELKNFNGFTPLHEAVISNSPEVIKFLVAYGANVDCKDGKGGRTPLHYAVELELLPVIQLLMNSGANVNAGSFSGNTPIQTASGRGLHHVTKLLLGNLQEASGRESRHESSRYKLKSTSTWKQ
ncbi:B-cell lymphoma 3 protein-like isoform X2 [Actinia tenebrosa]|uniref:B-cell lymphoma 3 protein-like isoform X2 n=1 Tax=Actinia tenebrosa TaxID=6105 RepID=A0A6P8IU93_ACTTE|nr:B-cell lymphoma 3 protein-like isoform X2 [Actinia tenebrosa]